MNKAEMAAAFAVFNPTRLFEKFDNVFKDIKWEEYTGYNKQFYALDRLGDHWSFKKVLIKLMNCK